MNRDFETIIWSAANGVTTITLNRPEVLNAMSPKLFDELEAAIDDAYVNDDTKVVILTNYVDTTAIHCNAPCHVMRN